MQEFYAHTSSHYSPKVLKLLSPPHPFSLFLPAPRLNSNGLFRHSLQQHLWSGPGDQQLLLDAVLIIISYIMILHAVLAIASREERIKSLQTCVSHICAVLVFYIPIIGLTMVHRFGRHLSPWVHVLMGNVYILFPPLMNPIIYSIKTQQIRRRVQRLFYLKKCKS